MRALALRISVMLVALAVVATPARAQRRRMRGARAGGVGEGAGPEIGGHLGYNFDVNNSVLGAQGTFPIAPQIDFYPSFDYYTVPNVTEWGLNFDLKLRPPALRFWYFGAGLNLLHTSAAGGNTDRHFNVFGGLEQRRGPLRPYAEAREILGNGSRFQLVAGLSFPIR